MRSPIPEKMALVTFALFFLWVTVPAGPPVRGQDQPKPRSPAEVKRITNDLERSFKALEASQREIPRDTFDPKAVVDQVGKDPSKLFQWVRDNTYWVPYQGTLRGPTGVLMDRLGNSLDRALLLAELLQASGQEVRLAQALLPPETAKRVEAAIRPIGKGVLAPATASDKKAHEAQLKRFAEQAQTDLGE